MHSSKNNTLKNQIMLVVWHVTQIAHRLSCTQIECEDRVLYQLDKPCNSTEERLRDLLAQDEWWYQQDVAHGMLLGRHDLYEAVEKNSLTTALAVRMDYVMDPPTDENQEGMGLMEQKVVDTILDSQSEWKHIKPLVMAPRSMDDELQRLISQDIHLFLFSFIVMSIFSSFALGKCDAVHSRTLLGILGIVMVIFGIIGSYGLCSMCGVPFSMMTMILPFILIGIGIDNTFVLVYAFDKTDTALPVPKRIALAFMRAGISMNIKTPPSLMKTSHDAEVTSSKQTVIIILTLTLTHTLAPIGMSITTTSITDVAAFIPGSLSKFPTVKWFFYYAAAMLALDLKRQSERRLDYCLCCLILKKTSDKVSSETKGKKSSRKELIPTKGIIAS